MFRLWYTVVIAVSAAGASAYAQTALEDCAAQFIEGSVANAPTIGDSSPGVPFGSNQHLCYQHSDGSFFATEYWPERFAPRWAAYRMDPEHYGADGCKTFTRDKGNCYVRAQTWAAFQSCTKASDLFHPDHMLDGPRLSPNDFSNTGHDRGHVAPRQAFSWHVCAAYQTFSMANMSPQSAHLNQDIWAELEQQVLTWAVDEGPLYVVTGTVYRRFPHERFEVYANGTFDGGQVYGPGTAFIDVVSQLSENEASFPAGHILRPLRSVAPPRVKDKVSQIRMPTGYYKVIYRPEQDGEQEHAIGFLLPHTFENLNHNPHFGPAEAFWSFVARIDLIEEVSGTRFPGIPEDVKRVWGDRFFLSRRTGREIRADSCGEGTPQGVVENTSKDERIAMCTATLRGQ